MVIEENMLQPMLKKKKIVFKIREIPILYLEHLNTWDKIMKS